jgi:DNA-binding beta-propeller fold protein YncE
VRVGLLLTAALAIVALPASAHAYTFAGKWGSTGSAPGQFDKPVNVALDPAGNVYVADQSNGRIQKFTADGGFIAEFGDSAGPGHLLAPYGVAVGPDGSAVYVTDGSDSATQHVFEYTATGTFVRSWGPAGSGNGAFSMPAAIAVGPTGNVYVADFGNERIQVFDAAGTFIKAWGSAGPGDGQFDGPDGVAIDSAGQVYVTEDGNQRVQLFDAAGDFVTKFGSAGSGDGQFDGPYAVATGPGGSVWLADAVNHRVQQFTGPGAFIAKFGSLGPGDGQLTTPNGLAVNCRGVYVADIDADRVQLFTDPSICPPPPPSPPAVKDTSAPKLRLSASRIQRVLRQKGIRVRLSANEDSAFTATATVALPRRAARTVRFKRSKATLKAGARKTIKLGLSKRNLGQLRKALKPRRRTLKAKLTITAKDAAGNSATVRRVIKLTR